MNREKIVFNGRLIKLCIKRHRYPNGYLTDMEIVRHPGAALIIPILNKDKVILIRQYRPVISSYIWELPAGTFRRNELPLSCAKRELLEEIGYVAKKWHKVGYIYTAPGYTTEKIHIFTAENLKARGFKKEPDELIYPMIVSKRQLQKMAESGAITDGKTISALAMAHLIR
jgi:ADP-ribose pyrophosphatase